MNHNDAIYSFSLLFTESPADLRCDSDHDAALCPDCGHAAYYEIQQTKYFL